MVCRSGTIIIAGIARNWSRTPGHRPCSGETTLIVGGNGLSIALGDSTVIASTDGETKYRKMYTVYVTNSARVSQASVPITLRIEPVVDSRGDVLSAQNKKDEARKAYQLALDICSITFLSRPRSTYDYSSLFAITHYFYLCIINVLNRYPSSSESYIDFSCFKFLW